MRAIAVRSTGAVPELTELPDPRPAPGEVLVRLAAASVNPFDWQIADGMFAGRMPHTFPLVLGVDGAGRVEAAGEAVQALRPGDIVHGQFFRAPIGTGTFADLVAVPEHLDSGAIQRVPDGMPAARAAALPTAGMTALGAMDAIDPRAGQPVLILGATGGVGAFAVQLAAARDALVIATARPDAARWIRQLGATVTADYSAGDLSEQVRKAHPGGLAAILDLTGDPVCFAECAELVRDGGTAVSVAFGATPRLLASDRITAINYMLGDKAELLSRITAEVAAGRIKVPVQREVALAETPRALAANRAGGARGKTVIQVRLPIAGQLDRDHVDDGPADLDLVTLFQPLGREDAAAVEPGAVGRPEVLDVPQAVCGLEKGMVARGVIVGEDQIALAARDELLVEDVGLVADLDHEGLGGKPFGEGHLAHAGDGRNDGLPGDLLLLGSVVP